MREFVESSKRAEDCPTGQFPEIPSIPHFPLHAEMPKISSRFAVEG
jgi:hypothetical protein